MKGKTLFSFKGLKTIITSEADSNITDLLSNTILGSKGGMRYKLTEVAERISAYSNIRFVSLLKGNSLMGTIGLCYRKVFQGRDYIHGTYLRYLSVMSRYQSSVDTGKRKKEARDSLAQDSMKARILSFIRKPEILGFPGFKEGDKSVVYAYVESKNERSKNMIHQAGFNYIRSFLTVAFSRFSPKEDPRVEKIDKAGRSEMLNLLSDYYSKYSLYTDETVFYKDSYYVIRSGDEIVAGMSAIPTTYNVVDVPAIWGWVFMNILPWLPFYRRLFRPGKFRFLVFGYPYVKPGHENDLEKLMESLCASREINTALTWVDDRSPLFDMFRKDIDMGALNRMLNAAPGLVYVNFLNITEQEKEFFYDNPVFISGFDFT